MINIISIVEEIIFADDFALKAIREGYMNYSQYARIIQPQVSKEALKPVGEKSIVVSLTRIAEKVRSEREAEVFIKNLSVHSNLYEISYEKTQNNLESLRKLMRSVPDDMNSYFTITEGLTELTIIGDKQILNLAKSLFKNQKPIFAKEEIAGITVKFSIEYLSEANVMYKIFTKLAVKGINIIEVVSTTTELTFFIEKPNTELAVRQLSKLLL